MTVAQRHRMPAVRALSDTGTSAALLVMWDNVNVAVNTTGHAEFPARILQRTYTFNKQTCVLTANGAQSVFHEPAGWATGAGEAHGPLLFKMPAGAPHAGRVLAAYTFNDATWPTDNRSIYLKYSDDDGATWSSATRIVNAAGAGLPNAGLGALVTGENSCFVRIPAGAHAGRICFPIYYTRSAVVYSDDGGDTWTVGSITPSMNGVSEPALSVWPDGTLIMTLRQDSYDAPYYGTRQLAKSTDGGASWTDMGFLPGYPGSICNASMIQTDIAGATGAYGRIVITGPESPGQTRNTFAIRSATDANMTFGERVAPFPASQYVGYSAVEALSGGYLALAYETGTVSFNVDEIVRLMVIKYPAGLAE
jgi:sialidase-1